MEVRNVGMFSRSIMVGREKPEYNALPECLCNVDASLNKNKIINKK